MEQEGLVRELIEELEEPSVPGDLEDPPVKPEVSCPGQLQVAGAIRALHLAHQSTHLANVPVRHPGDGGSDAAGLDGIARQVDLLVVRVDRGRDEGALARHEDHDARPGQRAERLADRDPADAVSLGEVELVQLGADPQVAAEDLVPDTVRRRLPQLAVDISRHERRAADSGRLQRS